MEQALLNFTLKLINEYGIHILYFITFITITAYYLKLRNRENAEFIGVITELVQSFNSLDNSVQASMKQNALISAAALSAMSGNKTTAKAILSNLQGGKDGEEC